MCPTVENPVLVHQQTGNSQGTSHPQPAEHDSRQAIQTWPDHSNRVVPSPRSVSSYMLPVAPASSGLVFHQIQQQTPTVCVTGPRPPGLGSGCTQPVLGKSGPICLPTSSHLGQSGGEVTGLPLQQDHSDCPRVAQHALVLGSNGNVQSDPSVSAQPGISTIQSDPAQEPVKPEPTCLALRATAIKEQGFSEAVAARIEAPQRGSTRSAYEAKWTICTLMSAKMRISPISWIVSRDRRGITSWNLSLVLHQRTKAPFEPLKEVSLKHLTFKTVFLLALGSGKRRSEIHAWLHKNIRHQSDWSKGSSFSIQESAG